MSTKEIKYVGIAIADYEITSPMLKVYVPELLPAAQDGEFSPGVSEANVQHKNILSSVKTTNVTTTNYIEATWYGSDNMMSPPHVRKGEQVEIFQISKSSNYYWRSLGRDPGLRTTDRWCVGVSAVEQENASLVNPDDSTNITERNDTNCYIFDMDSSNQRVRLKTTNVNGEKYSYTFEINGKSGNVVISDDKGGAKQEKCNTIVIDSDKNQVQLSNGDGSSIILAGENITLKCKNIITIDGEKQIITKSPCTTFNPNVDKGVFYKDPVVVFNGYSVTYNVNANIVYNGSGKMGINMPLKMAKVVTANTVRCNGMTTGDVGEEYSGSSINIADGSTHINNTTLDVDVSGLTKRTVASFVVVKSMIEKLEQAINEARAAVTLKPDNSATDIVDLAEIKDIKGT